MIRRLLEGEEVSHDGLVTVDRARLWELADPPPAPGRAGGVARERCARRRLERGDGDGEPAARQAARHGGRAPGRRRDAARSRCRCTCPGRRTEDEAESIAHDQWRSNVFGEPIAWDLETADAFDVVSEDVTVEQVRAVVDVSSDLAWHRDRLASYAEVGFDEVYLHHVGQSQEPFIDAFGEHVLPALKEG